MNHIALWLAGLLLPSIAVAQTSDGSHAQAMLARARAKDEAAQVACTQVIAKNPGEVRAYLMRGKLRDRLGDFHGAIADDDKALALDPKNAMAFSNRGNARAAMGDLAGASADYTRALALDPGHVAAYLNRANVEAMQRNYAAALPDYNAALALEPRNAIALYDRAGARRAVGRYADAAADYSQVLLQHPGDVRARLNRAVVRMAQRKWNDAVPDLRRCLQALAAERQIYPRLYLWVIGVKQGDGARATQELLAHAQQASAAYAATWPAQIEKFCAGEILEPAFLANALAAQTKKDKGQFAQACYFAGIRRQMTHTPDTSRLFEKSVKDGDAKLHEVILAREELKSSAP